MNVMNSMVAAMGKKSKSSVTVVSDICLQLCRVKYHQVNAKYANNRIISFSPTFFFDFNGCYASTIAIDEMQYYFPL